MSRLSEWSNPKLVLKGIQYIQRIGLTHNKK